MKTIVLILIFCLYFCSYAMANGSITGTIKYDGPLPHAKLVHMDADPVCYTINKGNIHSSILLLGSGDTLGNVFVYIKSGLTDTQYPVPAETIVINQSGCNYSPHILGVMKGQKVKFLNPDGTLHNVHAMCKVNPEFNEAMPEFRHEMVKIFEKPEFMFPIRCDVHPWMQAWLAVMGHPFFTVTGPDGKFELKNVPNGTYVIEAWHEKLNSQAETVTVTDHSTQKADFTFSEPK